MNLRCPFCSASLTAKGDSRFGICPNCHGKIRLPYSVPVYQKIGQKIVSSIRDQVKSEFERNSSILKDSIQTRFQNTRKEQTAYLSSQVREFHELIKTRLNELNTSFDLFTSEMKQTLEKEREHWKSQFREFSDQTRKTQKSFFQSVQKRIEDFNNETFQWFQNLQSSYKSHLESSLESLNKTFSEESAKFHESFQSQSTRFKEYFSTLNDSLVSDVKNKKDELESSFRSLENRLSKTQRDEINSLIKKVNLHISESDKSLSQFIEKSRARLEENFNRKSSEISAAVSRKLNDEFSSLRNRAGSFIATKEGHIQNVINQWEIEIRKFENLTRESLRQELENSFQEALVDIEKKVKTTLVSLEQLVNQILLGRN